MEGHDASAAMGEHCSTPPRTPDEATLNGGDDAADPESTAESGDRTTAAISAVPQPLRQRGLLGRETLPRAEDLPIIVITAQHVWAGSLPALLALIRDERSEL